MEYVDRNYPTKAFIDKINVGYDVYSIRTKKSAGGNTIEADTTGPATIAP